MISFRRLWCGFCGLTQVIHPVVFDKLPVLACPRCCEVDWREGPLDSPWPVYWPAADQVTGLPPNLEDAS